MKPILHRVALWLATTLALGAEPIRFTSAEATWYHGEKEKFLQVIDGIPAGPNGWSPAPQVDKPHALVIRCADPVEADELDIDLYFLAGRAHNTLSEFSLSYTTDAIPSLEGNWHPLEITRFAAEVRNLRRVGEARLRIDHFPFHYMGNDPDDVYHIHAKLPGRRATGFRLDAFPVEIPGSSEKKLCWHHPYDFSLTEFKVSIHVPETTNVALHQPVRSSHPLYSTAGYQQKSSNLTDGLPATMAHPHDSTLGAAFFYEIDLGRNVVIDHIGLRNRFDSDTNRMSHLVMHLHENEPTTDRSPSWKCMHRADGSSPGPGEVDILRAENGEGHFRGRYLRISSTSPIPNSPQLAEVEVYESRTPQLLSASADGNLLAIQKSLIIPPGALRLSLEVKIPQSGMPPTDPFRWRIMGLSQSWQTSSDMTLDIACPPPGTYVFEAQARHSDNQWDSTVYRWPIIVDQLWWKTAWFRWSSGLLLTVVAISSGMLWSRRRASQQLERLKAESALAEERARIARDLHDEIGANLTHISILSTLASDAETGKELSRQHNLEVASCARETIQAFDEILWSVNPKNDTLPSLCHYICRRVEEMLAPAGITYRFYLQEPMPDRPLPPNSRHQVLLAVKEALHNILKHAKAHNVQVICELNSQNRLRIEIKDDGCGFDPRNIVREPGQRRGMGLDDMNHRLTILGGECHMSSTAGMGTRITFDIPLSS
jgi:signal transduction histidine kinase